MGVRAHTIEIRRPPQLREALSRVPFQLSHLLAPVPNISHGSLYSRHTPFRVHNIIKSLLRVPGELSYLPGPCTTIIFDGSPYSRAYLLGVHSIIKIEGVPLCGFTQHPRAQPKYLMVLGRTSVQGRFTAAVRLRPNGRTPPNAGQCFAGDRLRHCDKLTGMEAIRTFYRGTWFRSKLEASYAQTFDYYNIEWVYEVNGYHIENVKYLPDFWLPEINTVLEVKGPLVPGVERAKKTRRVRREPRLVELTNSRFNRR